MRARLSFLFMLTMVLSIGNAQTTKTVGGVGANYATLKQAFDAINNGTLQGSVVLKITGNTTETASASLNASGTGSANYSSLTIYPESPGGYTVSTSVNTILVDLNGADNVTIDGRVNQSGSTIGLTFTNTNTGSIAATIRMQNSATGNIVRYCAITGSVYSSAMGIFTLYGANTGNGNDNNTLEYCSITNSGSRTINAVFSSGTSGRENSGNTIQYNSIYNVLSPVYGSSCIHFATNSTDNLVLGNSMYETAPLTLTAGNMNYNVIRIGVSAPHIVRGNFIGGSEGHCGGSAWVMGGNYPNYLCGIYVYAGSGTATIIENNTIQNISFRSTEDNPWDGIFLYSGNINVNGNCIGSPSGTGSIVITSPVAVATVSLSGGSVSGYTILDGGSGYTTPPTVTFTNPTGTVTPVATAILTDGKVTALDFTSYGSGYATAPSVIFDQQSNGYTTSHGMIQNSSGTVSISNNTIGSITTVGSDYYSHGWESIYVRSVNGITSITGNLIGSLTTPSSILVSSTANYSLLKEDIYGIYSAGTGTTTISGNTVANLKNNYTGSIQLSRTRGIATIAGTNTVSYNTVHDISNSNTQTSAGSASSVMGIMQTASTDGTNQVVSGNLVYNLSNTNPSVKSYVTGIYYSGPITGTNLIQGNFVHSLSISSGVAASVMIGLEIYNGVYTCSNNIINIGTGISSDYIIYGIWDETLVANARSFYFNTSYISGTVTSGTNFTAAFRSQTNNATRNVRDNLFVNARSAGGKHYALYLPGVTGLTIDYNDYYVSGANGVLGYIGGDKTTLALIQAATGQDSHSLNLDPSFSLPGGTSAINYYPSAAVLGVSGTGVLVDYFDAARSGSPRMGAIENNTPVWQGGTSTDFATGSNWSTGTVPLAGSDIIFATNPSRDCYLDGNRTVGIVTNASGKNLVVNGHTLSLTKSLNFSGSGKISASSSSSVVEFNGSEAQSLQSQIFESGTIYALKVNNSTGVSLSGDLIIGSSLTLTSGTFSIGGNQLTLAGNTLVRTSGNIDASNGASTLVFSNSDPLTLPSGLFASSLTNLTINGAGGVVAGENLTVNGILNLAASNPSTSKGILELVISYTNYPGTTNTDYLSSYVLTMGTGATTIGVGDVTGTIKRNNIVANTPYSFGNQFTTISLTDGNMPSSISVSVTLGTTPGSSTPLDDKIRDAIRRSYEIVPVGGSNCYVTANFHYLTNELQSSLTGYTNTELKLTTMDYDIGPGGMPYSDEHGRANYDFVNKFIGLSSVPISYFIKTETHQWRTIFALRDYGEAYYQWNGSQSTDWTNADNWTLLPFGSGVPNEESHVIIPDVSSTYDRSPVVPNGTVINTISIENGGVLDLGSSVLTIQNTFSGGWEDQNPGGNDPGTSTVVFALPPTYVIQPHSTISGHSKFYNLQIADGVDLTNQAGSSITIENSIVKSGSGTGLWYADIYENRVEYLGGSQTILQPDGSHGYYHLLIGGTGTKVMPSAAMEILGDFTIEGSCLVEAAGNLTIGGQFTIGSLADYSAGSYAHSYSNFILYSDENGTGSLLASTPFSGTVQRYIPNDFHWHFLSSPVSSQNIWPEFAPDTLDGKSMGTAPWNWDFYYWNPKANISNQLYWVNLRKTDGTYNANPIDQSGSGAGFGSVIPKFEAGRGYLVAYSDGWNQNSGSPQIHQFTGTIQSGNISRTILNDANQFNLVGNPYPSAVDWSNNDGWTRDGLAASGGGYDYWIFNDQSGNYGVFNSSDVDGFGTLGTSRYIASMQAFFVTAASSGSLTFKDAARVHADQEWLKQSSESINALRLKLSTTSSSYRDEVMIKVDPSYTQGGSPKFWSIYQEAPELYVAHDDQLYSIARFPDLNENSTLFVGVKPGSSGTFTLQALGGDQFHYSKSVVLEDLKSGATQDLKLNPAYSFSASPQDEPIRFKLHFGGPFGIEPITISSSFTVVAKREMIQVSLDEIPSHAVEVTLYSMLGECMLTASGSTSLITIPVHLESGCYIIQVKSDKGVESKKVVIY